MNIGARLRKLRKHYGLTGEDLAEIFGVTKSRISQIESGDGVPSIDQIIKLRRKVEFSSDWLVFGSGRAPWDDNKPLNALYAVAEKLPAYAVQKLTHEGSVYAELIERAGGDSKRDNNGTDG